MLKKSGFLPNEGVVAVISMAVSAFGLYGIQKSGFLIEDFLSGIGFSRDFVFDVIPWIVLVMAMVIIWKWGFGMLLMIFGALLFFLGVFGISYESGLSIFLGIILFFFGLWRFFRRRKKKKFKADLNALDLDKREAFKKNWKLEQKMKRKVLLNKAKKYSGLELAKRKRDNWDAEKTSEKIGRGLRKLIYRRKKQEKFKLNNQSEKLHGRAGLLVEEDEE